MGDRAGVVEEGAPWGLARPSMWMVGGGAVVRWEAPGPGEQATFGNKCLTTSEDEGVIWRCVEGKGDWISKACAHTELTESEGSVGICRNPPHPNPALIHPVEPGWRSFLRMATEEALWGSEKHQPLFRMPCLAYVSRSQCRNTPGMPGPVTAS